MDFTQQSESNDITLLLVGSAGNGKSATGNSILRQQAFETTASTSATMSEIAVASSRFNNLTLKVVDVPATDTDTSEEEFLNSSTETVKQALKQCDYRFSALVIVLKYGARFTKQETEFIKTIKGILGKNVIRDFGVCLMTHGDNFEYDNEDGNVKFRDWCEKQEGEIKNLFQECNDRCVLFNNRTKDLSLQDLQLSELMANVRRDIQYEEGDFRAADADLQKLVMQTKAPNISNEACKFIETKRREIQHFQPNSDVGEEIRFYETIKKDIKNKESSLRKEYGKFDLIDKYFVDVKVFKLEITNKIRSLLILKKKNEQINPSDSQLRYQKEPANSYSSDSTNSSSLQPIYLSDPADSSSSQQRYLTEPANSSSSQPKCSTEPAKSSSSHQRYSTEHVNSSSSQPKLRPNNKNQQVRPDSSRSKNPTERDRLNSSGSKVESGCCSLL